MDDSDELIKDCLAKCQNPGKYNEIEVKRALAILKRWRKGFCNEDDMVPYDGGQV